VNSHIVIIIHPDTHNSILLIALRYNVTIDHRSGSPCPLHNSAHIAICTNGRYIVLWFGIKRCGIYNNYIRPNGIFDIKNFFN